MDLVTRFLWSWILPSMKVKYSISASYVSSHYNTLANPRFNLVKEMGREKLAMIEDLINKGLGRHFRKLHNENQNNKPYSSVSS